ncbi:MAG: penicillin-binding protein [Bdellovibrio sp.]|nr:MAG: penicillin-binding protein [Bdellovibrio sp.]
MKFALAGLVGRWLLLLGPWAVAGLYLLQTQPVSRAEDNLHAWLVDQISENLRHKRFPREITLPSGEAKPTVYTLEYTVDWDLQHEAERLLESYKPDYGALVVLNAETGKVKAIASFERTPTFNENLAIKATFPAASVFKMVTAAAAVDRYRFDPDAEIQFNGGNHTLYKRNVFNDNVNRWTRSVTLREAFARSLNTAFGRLAVERLEPQDIRDYALRFGFNRQITGDFKFESGYTDVPMEKSFQLAEIASGFNRVTKMSPIQGALMAAAIARGGEMPMPLIVERIQSEDGEVIGEAVPRVDHVVLSPEGVESMKALMRATVSSGTSRKAFRHLRRDAHFKDLEIGGKTGSLTGLSPKGRTDWFVGYAIGENNERLAIGAVTVHVNLWRVKSAVLAQSLVEKYFRQPLNWQFGRGSVGDEVSCKSAGCTNGKANDL